MKKIILSSIILLNGLLGFTQSYNSDFSNKIRSNDTLFQRVTEINGDQIVYSNSDLVVGNEFLKLSEGCGQSKCYEIYTIKKVKLNKIHLTNTSYSEIIFQSSKYTHITSNDTVIRKGKIKMKLIDTKINIGKLSIPMKKLRIERINNNEYFAIYRRFNP